MASYEHPYTFEHKAKRMNEPLVTEEIIETAMLLARKNGYPVDAWRLFAQQARDDSLSH